MHGATPRHVAQVLYFKITSITSLPVRNAIPAPSGEIPGDVARDIPQTQPVPFGRIAADHNSGIGHTNNSYTSKKYNLQAQQYSRGAHAAL